MTHVILSTCTRQGDCVEVCPVDCIVPGPTDDSKWNDLFFIDPDACIDCAACVPVCPPEAILTDDEAPESDTERNAAFFESGPGYWDYEVEEERGTYKGEKSARDSR